MSPSCQGRRICGRVTHILPGNFVDFQYIPGQKVVPEHPTELQDLAEPEGRRRPAELYPQDALLLLVPFHYAEMKICNVMLEQSPKLRDRYRAGHLHVVLEGVIGFFILGNTI